MANSHELHYTENHVALCGVKEVIEFTDTAIVLSLEGTGLRINGHGLKIKEVDLDKGVLRASGAIASLSYGGGGKEGILKRIFK